jgi:putative serine protease PepD
MQYELGLRMGGTDRWFSPGTSVTVGRSPNADVKSTNSQVSREHARFAVHDGSWILEDLSSSRGTFSEDGARITRFAIARPLVVWLGGIGQGDRVEVLLRSIAAASPTAGARTGSGPDIVVRLAGQDRRFTPDRVVSIGRGDGVDVGTDNPYVSHEHARLRLDGGTWVLEDAGSKRGIYQNGSRIPRLAISGPVIVWLGDPAAGAELQLTPRVTSGAGTPGGPLPAVVQAPVGQSTVMRLMKANTRRTVAIAAAVAVLVGGVVGIIVANRGGSPGEPNLQALKRATVLITDVKSNPQNASRGSGTIISKDGLILTNDHVAAIGNPAAPGLGPAYLEPPEDVDKAIPLVIYMTGGTDKPVEAKYLAHQVVADGYLDFAILQIDSTVDGAAVDSTSLDLPFIPVGDSNKITAGDPLWVLGFPGVSETTSVSVTRGLVESFIKDSRTVDPRTWINTDAVIAPGNSGGLAADAAGRLIGVPSAHAPIPGVVIGKIRAIDLALPLIEAARQGKPYDQYRFTKALGGTEKLSVAGWQMGESEGCSGQTVTSYGAGTTAIYPQIEYAGMSPGIDVLIMLREPGGESLPIDAFQWTAENGTEGCFVEPLGSQNDLPSGAYLVEVFAGPNYELGADSTVLVGG